TGGMAAGSEVPGLVAAAGAAAAGAAAAAACSGARAVAVSGRTSDVAAPMTIAAPRKHSVPITMVRVLTLRETSLTCLRPLARAFFGRSIFRIRIGSSLEPVFWEA